MKYRKGDSYNLTDGGILEIVDVSSSGVDAVLITEIGDYIEYEDVSQSTIDSLIKVRSGGN